MLFNGTLNVYFPCELKNSREMLHIRRMLDDLMACHRNMTRTMRTPNTNQMDLLEFRRQKESILRQYQAIWADRFNVSLPIDAGCYATAELADEYRHPREDNLFVKNISLRLSEFDVSYPPLQHNNNNVSINGQLLFSVNLDNRVATAVLALRFKNMDEDDIILLKHTLYKRCQLSISENPGLNYSDTFQGYVTRKLEPIYPYIETDMDCRARYMLLEVYEPIANYPKQSQRELSIHAMLTCDEGWRYANDICIGKDYSTRDSYQLFFNRKNAIIITSKSSYNKYVDFKKRVWSKIQTPINHIGAPAFTITQSIAGLDKHLFAKYLKTVELDYLITDVLTSEISGKIMKSFKNPFLLFRRGYKLWKILNELDLNIYHIDKDMQNSFGINEKLDEIRVEYRDTVSLLTNYLIILVAILTLIATIT